MLGLLKKPRTRRLSIGLDIGSTGARAVQLTQEGDRFVLAATSRIAWEGHGENDGTRDAQFERWVKSTLGPPAFRRRSAVAALDPSAVDYHALTMPADVMDGQATQVDRIVHWELQRLAEEQDGPTESRHWVLPAATSNAPNAIGVVAPADAVNSLLFLMQRAKLQPERVDVGATALTRLGAALHRAKETEIWGVMDVGFSECRLVLCRGSVPIVVRRAGSGGQVWTKHIAETLQLSAKNAETHKRTYGLMLSEASGTEACARGVASMVTGALRSALRGLTGELKRSFEYALSCYPESTLTQLILTGGAGGMTNLAEFLEDALGITVRRASSLVDTPSSSIQRGRTQPEHFDSLALAVGLSLGS